MTAGIVSATGRDIQAPNGHDHRERDPDGRADQPRQLGRAAARPLRPRRRHQRADRGRDGRRERRDRLRDPERRPREPSRERADRHAATPSSRGSASRSRRSTRPSPSVVRGLPSHGVVVLRVTSGGPAAKAGIVASTRQVTVGGVTAFTGGDSIVAVEREARHVLRPAGRPPRAARAGRPREARGRPRPGARARSTSTLGNVPG